MAKQKFNPESLATFASADIRPPIGVGALVWRYTIFVPTEEQRFLHSEPVILASPYDLESLQTVLVDHFGGVSMLGPLVGIGLRDPRDPQTLEMNKSLPFVVYARPVTAADRYFEKLQMELQEALDQGLVLVERQEAFLLGEYRLPEVRAIRGPGSAEQPRLQE